MVGVVVVGACVVVGCVVGACVVDVVDVVVVLADVVSRWRITPVIKDVLIGVPPPSLKAKESSKKRLELQANKATTTVAMTDKDNFFKFITPS